MTVHNSRDYHENLQLASTSKQKPTEMGHYYITPILNKVKIQNTLAFIQRILIFQNPPLFCLSASHKTHQQWEDRTGFSLSEDQHVTLDMLLQLRFIHCAVVSTFILHCSSFTLTDQMGDSNLPLMHYRPVLIDGLLSRWQ